MGALTELSPRTAQAEIAMSVLAADKTSDSNIIIRGPKPPYKSPENPRQLREEEIRKINDLTPTDRIIMETIVDTSPSNPMSAKEWLDRINPAIATNQQMKEDSLGKVIEYLGDYRLKIEKTKFYGTTCYYYSPLFT